MRPTPAQLSYIDSLYEQLDIPFSKRKHAADKQSASVLICDLQNAVDEKRNTPDGDDW